MAQLLVRDIDARTLARLKKRAVENRRSLQGEVKVILEEAADRMTLREFRAAAEQMRKRLRRRRFSDSANLIRADRER